MSGLAAVEAEVGVLLATVRHVTDPLLLVLRPHRTVVPVGKVPLLVAVETVPVGSPIEPATAIELGFPGLGCHPFLGDLLGSLKPFVVVRILGYGIGLVRVDRLPPDF